jgi:hypothetical protein
VDATDQPNGGRSLSEFVPERRELIRVLSTETHENWIEATRYLYGSFKKASKRKYCIEQVRLN